MKTKKICAAILAVTMTCGMFAGCGNTASESGDTTTAGGADTTAAADNSGDSADTTAAAEQTSGETVTLEVLTHRTDIVQDGSLDALTDAFEAENNCVIKYTGYTNYADDVSTRMSTDDYGDVLMIPDSVKLSDLSYFFEPLDSYDNAKNEWDCVDTKMYDNTVYGYPTALNLAGGVLYNKQVFADAGITELPNTPDEFIADLGMIADNCEGVIPLYTNFADNWTLAQWQGLVCSASGDPSYETNLLINRTDLFAEGGAYYTVYKMMYDIFSDTRLREADPTSTEWEGSKTAFAQGKIGTLVLGSWAVSQFKQAATDIGADPENVGYMPMPNTVDGVKYAQISADYSMGVNVHSENKELAKKFVEWYCGESGLAQSETAICALKGSALPDFMEGVTTFVNAEVPEEYVGVFNQIDKDSEVGTWDTDTANFKVKLSEAAFSGKGEDEFNAIISDVNSKWNATRDAVLGE